MRLKVFEHIFGFRTKEAAEVATLDVIERGVKIMQAYEKRCTADPEILKKDETEILMHLDADIAAYDMQATEEDGLELPSFGS